MKQVKQGLSSLVVISILLLPLVGWAETLIHWVYISDIGNGHQIMRESRPSISVETLQPGEYVVTFPRNVKKLGCTATQTIVVA